MVPRLLQEELEEPACFGLRSLEPIELGVAASCCTRGALLLLAGVLGMAAVLLLGEVVERILLLLGVAAVRRCTCNCELDPSSIPSSFRLARPSPPCVVTALAPSVPSSLARPSTGQT